MIARNGSALVGDLITHIDSIPTASMNHSEPHRALQGPEYTSVSLGVADLQGNTQRISVLRSPPSLYGSIDFELHDLHANAYFEMHFFRASFISSFIYFELH